MGERRVTGFSDEVSLLAMLIAIGALEEEGDDSVEVLLVVVVVLAVEVEVGEG